MLTAFAALLWFLFEAFSARIPFPFDLEWIEGGMLAEALRLRRGQPLYVEPTAEFIPSIYPPLYPWLLGLLGEPSYLAGRALSALASLVSIGLAVFAVRRERLAWGAALGAGAIFVVCYEDAGTFFDIARMDALALMFAAAAVVVARVGTPRTAIVAGLALALAFATKQNYALFGAAIAGWLLVTGRRRALIAFLLASIVPAAGYLAVAVWRSDGWAWTYLFSVPRGHPWVAERAWPIGPFEIWSALRPVSTAAIVALLVLLPIRRRGLFGGAIALLAAGLCLGLWAGADDPWVGSGTAALLTAALGAGLLWLGRGQWDEGSAYAASVAAVACVLALTARAHFGSYTNALLPAFWGLAIATATVLGRLVRRYPKGAVPWIVAGFLCWQAYDGFWQQRAWLPTEAERTDGERIVARLAALDGTVFMPHAPWYPRLAGKEPSYTVTAQWDLQHPRSPLRDRSGVIAEGLARGRWDYVVAPLAPPFGHGLERHYVPVETLVADDGEALVTRVGYPIRFGTVWRRRAGVPRAGVQDGGSSWMIRSGSSAPGATVKPRRTNIARP